MMIYTDVLRMRFNHVRKSAVECKGETLTDTLTDVCVFTPLCVCVCVSVSVCV